MASLPPDDDGSGLDDAFSALPPVVVKPKRKAKAKTKASAPVATKTKKDRKQTTRSKNQKGECGAQAGEPSQSSAAQAGELSQSSGPSKAKSEAGMDYAHHATSIVGQSFECNDFVCHFMGAKFGGLSMYNSKAFYVLWAAASPPLRPTIPFQDILNELKCLQPAKQHLRCHFWEIYSRPRIAPVVRDLGMRALRSIDVTWLCAGPCN